MKSNGYKLHMIRFKNDGIIQSMKSYASEGCFATKHDFKEAEKYYEQALQS